MERNLLKDPPVKAILFNVCNIMRTPKKMLSMWLTGTFTLIDSLTRKSLLKKALSVIIICVFVLPACLKAQKIDSIFFHLYTDSLKKGTYNYINVDGKSADGHWLPLTDKQITFTTTGGKFEANSLVLDKGFAAEKVTVTAVLKGDTSIHKRITIYIKKKNED